MGLWIKTNVFKETLTVRVGDVVIKVKEGEKKGGVRLEIEAPKDLGINFEHEKKPKRSRKVPKVIEESDD